METVQHGRKMHSVRIHKVIGWMISLFYLIGIWHRGDKPTVKEMRIQFLYSIYCLLIFPSFIVGAIKNDNKGEWIFLAELSIGAVVVVVKLWILIWKQNEIRDLLNIVCVLSIQNDNDHKHFNNRIEEFIKYSSVFLIASVVAGVLSSVVLSVLGDEKSLFLEIAFPLDYRNSEIAFWIATIFLFNEYLLYLITAIFTVIIWYLLVVCALRYEVLGSELKNMGRTSVNEDRQETDTQMHKNYFENLTTSIDAHLYLRKCASMLHSNLCHVSP